MRVSSADLPRPRAPPQTKHNDVAPLFTFLRLQPFDKPLVYNQAIAHHVPEKSGRGRHAEREGLQPWALLSLLMRTTVMRHMKTQMLNGSLLLELPGPSKLELFIV